MNLKISAIALIALVASCASSSNDATTIASQHAKIGNLGFDAPATWQRKDTSLRTSTTSVWTPTTNPAKESISVIRTVVNLPGSTGPAEIQKLLLQAQTGLHEAQLTSVPSEITSATGLRGVQVSVDYLPSQATQRYHRVHAVLLDGTFLIHVFYTAVEPDRNGDAFRLVLNSLRHEEV